MSAAKVQAMLDAPFTGTSAARASGQFPVETATLLRSAYLAAGKRHHLEYALEAKARSVIRLLLRRFVVCRRIYPALLAGCGIVNGHADLPELLKGRLRQFHGATPRGNDSIAHAKR